MTHLLDSLKGMQGSTFIVLALCCAVVIGVPVIWLKRRFKSKRPYIVKFDWERAKEREHDRNKGSGEK